MCKVKILVVEDEIIIADDICQMLSELGYQTPEPVINYSEAVIAIEKYNPDLAILDIQLAGSKNGIDLAWKIKEDYDFPFIFLTSYADSATVEKAKKATPSAYLVKPFNKEDLYTSIEMALYNYSINSGSLQPLRKENKEKDFIIKDTFFIKDKHLIYKVKFSEIVYVRAEHVYVEINTNTKKKYLSRRTLTEFAEKLPKNFFRIQRGYIVNLDYLNTINSKNVIVDGITDGITLPIGKNYREELMKRINIG